MIWRFLIARMIQVRVMFKIMEETVFIVFRSEMVKSNAKMLTVVISLMSDFIV